jgi:AraC-like DNA-binding protein
MKPLLKIIDTQQHEAFQLLRVDESFFFPSWHFHPEYEIMLVLEGRGIRFVGDSIERFEPGDLVFLGKDIPHFYRSDEEYYLGKSLERAKALVVYFKEDFLGDAFWNLADTAMLKKLFSDAKRGVRFQGTAKEEISEKVKELSEHSAGISKVIDLLSIFQIMSGAETYDVLSSRGFAPYPVKSECERMNQVYSYILDNYTKSPSLAEVACHANMSVVAFCKYFKSRTNKTYTRFLNEIKIGNACKLLIEDRLSISQICFKTGFNNLTHFNSQFKRSMGHTPTRYQQQHFEGSNIPA